MINLPNEMKLLYNESVASYNLEIRELKHNFKLAKQNLMLGYIKPYPINPTKDEKIAFVHQLIYNIPHLVLFPEDEVVLTKLRGLKFGTNILKWFVSLEDISKEIERLINIKGLLFLPNSYLTAISNHLQFKILYHVIEDFELTIDYNNAETNIAFKDFAERFRKRAYNSQKGQTGETDVLSEKIHNDMFDILEAKAGSNEVLKQALLSPLKDNTSFYYSKLDEFYCEGISKNKVYCELFELLKMIMKDYELLSEKEFKIKNTDGKYDSDYRKYKIARVKKILQKK